jgi:hypothetical protein
MDDGSGPIRPFTRMLAGLLGLAAIVGGVTFLVAAPWSLGPTTALVVVLEGPFALSIGALFLKAAWTGSSPAWPD